MSRWPGLIHKMGYRGTTVDQCSTSGEQGRCVGYLVGEPHKGLTCMFHMMNEARVGVGLGAVDARLQRLSACAGLCTRATAGASAGGQGPAKPQVRIAEHADVRRMLLAQKAYVEGGLALCLYAARLVDDQYTGRRSRCAAKPDCCSRF